MAVRVAAHAQPKSDRILVCVGNSCPIQGSRLHAKKGGPDDRVLEVILHSKGGDANAIQVFFGLKVEGDLPLPPVGTDLLLLAGPA